MGKEIKVTFIGEKLYTPDTADAVSVELDQIQAITTGRIMISGRWFKVVEKKEFFLLAKEWMELKKPEKKPIKRPSRRKPSSPVFE